MEIVSILLKYKEIEISNNINWKRKILILILLRDVRDKKLSIFIYIDNIIGRIRKRIKYIIVKYSLTILLI